MEFGQAKAYLGNISSVSIRLLAVRLLRRIIAGIGSVRVRHGVGDD